MGHYLVTRAGVRQPARVRAFADWLRAEMQALDRAVVTPVPASSSPTSL